jgi:hypothetical protein
VTKNTMTQPVQSQPVSAAEPSIKAIETPAYTLGELNTGKILAREGPLWNHPESGSATLHTKYNVHTHDVQKQDLPVKWFVSVGVLSNDYSLTTIETKVGHKRLYAVLDGGLLRDGSSIVFYGAGTSITLSQNFAINPVYLYRHAEQTRDYTLLRTVDNMTVAREVKNGLHQEMFHHQMKLVVQYKPSSRLNLQGGAILNARKITNTIIVPMYVQRNHYSDVSNTSGVAPAPSNYSLPQNVETFRDHTIKYFVGFEIGVSYRIDIAH